MINNKREKSIPLGKEKQRAEEGGGCIFHTNILQTLYFQWGKKSRTPSSQNWKTEKKRHTCSRPLFCSHLQCICVTHHPSPVPVEWGQSQNPSESCSNSYIQSWAGPAHETSISDIISKRAPINTDSVWFIDIPNKGTLLRYIIWPSVWVF